MVSSEVRGTFRVPTTSRTPRRLAVGAALAIALVYAAIFLGVVSVGRADSGELGILGVAGALFLIIAVVLWRTSSRTVWIGVIALQAILAVMYVQIAPDREPAFEFWGLAIRALSVVLVVALVWLFAASLGNGRGGSTEREGTDVDAGGGA